MQFSEIHKVGSVKEIIFSSSCVKIRFKSSEFVFSFRRSTSSLFGKIQGSDGNSLKFQLSIIVEENWISILNV